MSEDAVRLARNHATEVMQRVLERETGPDVRVVKNSAGGLQADLPFAPTLLPQWALLEVSRLLANGAVKYQRDNWRLIRSTSHMDHGITHGLLHLAGDTSEGPLGHLVRHACRAMMALEMALVEHHGGALDPRLVGQSIVRIHACSPEDSLGEMFRQDSIELTEDGIAVLGKDRRRRTRKGKKRR